MKRMVPPGVLAAALVLALGGCSAARSGATVTGYERVTLRVMTYNIQAGGGNLHRVGEAIQATATDLAALQEVDVHWSDRSQFVDQATALAEQLGMQVRFAHIYRLTSADSDKTPREYGVALLSKYPIVSWANRPLTRLSTQTASAVPAPGPGFLEALIDFRGVKIRVFNTHLDYRADPQVRRQQVSEMLAYIGEAKSPTILMGDLNAPPEAQELQPLFGRLEDTWQRSAGTGFTYPAAEPVRRIDYVLASRHFLVRDARVPMTLASDHRPVLVELEIFLR
jgi:endonuclease/exonuclease/phosphatase family metal-dependent hydrolase